MPSLYSRSDMQDKSIELVNLILGDDFGQYVLEVDVEFKDEGFRDFEGSCSLIMENVNRDDHIFG